jgi:hypothetical protein
MCVDLPMRTLRGNILPLALVITATILLAGVTLGTIVLQSLKRSVDTDNSIDAYYAADAGIERQLFVVRKQNATVASLNAMTNSFSNGSTWVAESGSHYVTTNVKTFPQLTQGDVQFVDLYDPDNLGAAANVGQVRWTWSDSSALCQVELGYAEWTAGAVVIPDVFEIVTASNHAGSQTLTPTKAYRLRFRPKNCPITNLQIRVYQNAGDPSPITFPGDITIAAEGTYRSSKQAIAVTMPRLDVLSSVFNYVIFSENPLIKN